MINKKQMWSDSPFNQWTEEELLCMKYQGICYGKGGGSAPPPPPATQTVRQSSEFPEELKPFVKDIFGKAQAIQEQRQEEGFRPELTQQLAAFTPDQQAAFTGIREQVGQTRPLFEEATQLTRGATRAATDPAEVAALMNPFLRNVTDIEKREARRVADVEEQQLAAQAAQAGAFGGSRAAILEAERQRNLAQQLGDIEARGRLAAFQDAQARLQNQFGREAAGAAQLSALGTAIPAQTFKELGALSGIGAAEQQQAQRALDIATQQAREEYGFPMQTLQDFQSILRGFPLPATTNVSRQSFSPAQPLSTQLLGLGTGLAGLAGAAGAFKKAGGLVGAPVAMKNGGYVKLAGGGGLGQLMQGKVKKYAEGGSTQMELISQYTVKELEQLLNNPARVAELGFSPTLVKAELNKKIGARASMQDAARARAQSQFIEGIGKAPGELVEAAKNLPGQLMSLGQSAADATQQGFQAVAPYIPKSGMFADEAAALVDSAKNLIPQGDPRLGMDTAQRIDPTGMTGETRIPASLIKAPTASPVTSAPPAAPPVFGSTSTVMGGSYNPVPRRLQQEVASPSPSSSLKDFLAAPKLSFTVDPMKPPPPGSDLMIQQSEADKMFSPDVLTKMYGEGAEDFLTERFTGTGSPLLSAASAPIQLQIDKAREEVQEKQSERPLLDEETTVEAEQKRADAARKAISEPVSTAVDKQVNTRKNLLKPELTEEQAEKFDIDQYKKDYEAIEGKDFMSEVRERIGEVPALEKRKEFDANPRVSAMLMKAAGAILGSTKGPIEAMAGAFNVIGKDMTELADARTKYEDAARQERNQETLRKYNQEIKFFEAGERQKAKALQNLTNVAQVTQKYDNNQINRQKARVSIVKDLNAMTMADFEFANKQVDRQMTEEGTIFLGELNNIRTANDRSIASKLASGAGLSGQILTKESKNAVKNVGIEQDIRLLERLRGKVRVRNEAGKIVNYDVQPEIDSLRNLLGGGPKNPQVGRDAKLPATSRGRVTATTTQPSG